ncbi:unnamed protein product [Pylaiella littoralis]
MPGVAQPYALSWVAHSCACFVWFSGEWGLACSPAGGKAWSQKRSTLDNRWVDGCHLCVPSTDDDGGMFHPAFGRFQSLASQQTARIAPAVSIRGALEIVVESWPTTRRLVLAPSSSPLQSIRASKTKTTSTS